MTHLDELLSVYLDGEATRPEVARIERHLTDCHRCRRRLDEINFARTAVRSLPLIELPANLVPADEESAPTHRRPAVWVGAAAAVAAAVVAVATLFTPAQPPLDLSQVSLQFGARSSLDAGSATFKVVVPDVAAVE